MSEFVRKIYSPERKNQKHLTSEMRILLFMFLEINLTVTKGRDPGGQLTDVWGLRPSLCRLQPCRQIQRWTDGLGPTMVSLTMFRR